MIAENESLDAEPNDDGEQASTELARTMLADGFTKPIVVNALMAEGVDREQAIAVVNRLLKDRFRATQVEQKVEQQSINWAIMAVGGVMMLLGGIPLANALLKLANEGSAVFGTVWWWFLTGGFFVFLFGITRKSALNLRTIGLSSFQYHERTGRVLQRKRLF